MAAEIITVRVSFDVKINTNAWADNYGVEGAEIPADVRSYIESGIIDQLESVGVLVR